MAIEINLKIGSDFIPNNLYIETAKYLLAIAGIEDAAAFIKSQREINHGVASDGRHSTNESNNDGNNNTIEEPPTAAPDPKPEHVLTIDEMPSQTHGRGINPAIHKVEVDITGAPWDYRIHSSSKSKTADGKWRMKRNVTEKTAEKVNENNKAALEAPKASIPPPPMQEDLFPKFMTKVTEAISKGKTNHLALVKLLQNYGIPDVVSVNVRQDLIPTLILEIEKL